MKRKNILQASRHKFSLGKFSFSLATVGLGAGLFGVTGQTVHADSTPPVTQSQTSQAELAQVSSTGYSDNGHGQKALHWQVNWNNNGSKLSNVVYDQNFSQGQTLDINSIRAYEQNGSSRANNDDTAFESYLRNHVTNNGIHINEQGQGTFRVNGQDYSQKHFLIDMDTIPDPKMATSEWNQPGAGPSSTVTPRYLDKNTDGLNNYSYAEYTGFNGMQSVVPKAEKVGIPKKAKKSTTTKAAPKHKVVGQTVKPHGTSLTRVATRKLAKSIGNPTLSQVKSKVSSPLTLVSPSEETSTSFNKTYSDHHINTNSVQTNQANQVLPQTGENKDLRLTAIGVIVVTVLGFMFVTHNYKHNQYND